MYAEYYYRDQIGLLAARWFLIVQLYQFMYVNTSNLTQPGRISEPSCVYYVSNQNMYDKRNES
jgi:hypothetical protein